MSSDVGWLGMAPQSCARCVQHIVTELCGVRASSEGRTSNICSRIVQKPCLIPTQQHTQHAHRRSDKYSPCRPAHKGDTSRDTQQRETHTNHDEYNSPLLLAVEPVLRDCTAVRTCEGCTVQVGPAQPSHRFHDKLGREIRLAQSTAHHGAFGISGREHRAQTVRHRCRAGVNTRCHARHRAHSSATHVPTSTPLRSATRFMGGLPSLCVVMA